MTGIAIDLVAWTMGNLLMSLLPLYIWKWLKQLTMATHGIVLWNPARLLPQVTVRPFLATWQRRAAFSCLICLNLFGKLDTFGLTAISIHKNKHQQLARMLGPNLVEVQLELFS